MRTLIILLIGIAFIALISVCGETDVQFAAHKDKTGSSYVYK